VAEAARSLDADEPPSTLTLAPRGVSEMYAAKPQPTRGTKPRRAEGSGGADDEPEGQAPCGTRGWAVIVVLLVLAWAAGWSEPPAPPPAAPTHQRGGELAG
jgi:hypothetical protein